MGRFEIIQGDALEVLRRLGPGKFRCCVTSPPYWGLRDYNMAGQIGLESDMKDYIGRLVGVFEEVKRVLANDGTLWLNLGDCYIGSGSPGGDFRDGKGGDSYCRPYRRRGGNKKANVFKQSGKIARGEYNKKGLKNKDLAGIPWRTAFALQDAGWWLRSDIIWHKPNPMPESVQDRPSKSYEHIFLFAKSRHYFYDAEAVKEPAKNWGKRDRSAMRNGTTDPKLKHHGLDDGDFSESGRNMRDVWTITTKPYREAHYATFPLELPERCLRAGTAAGDWAIDPFCGSGTTGEAALKLGRNFTGIELNPEYCEMARGRISGVMPLFTGK